LRERNAIASQTCIFLYARQIPFIFYDFIVSDPIILPMSDIVLDSLGKEKFAEYVAKNRF